MISVVFEIIVYIYFFFVVAVGHWFRSSMDHWGQNKFISISEMKNYLNLNKDCCSLQVEVCVEALVS